MPEPANPEIQFEELLKQAAKDPALRPQFLRNFLNYDLYVIGKPEGDFIQGPQGFGVANQNTTLKLQCFNINGKNQIAVFSSLERLQKAFQGEITYTRLKGKNLFETLPPGSRVILNPFSDCGKEFSWEEIEGLLDGTIFQINPQEIKEANQSVVLSPPANYPNPMIRALIRYFESKGMVEKAYLAQIDVKGSGDPPHCVVGVKMVSGSTKSFEEVVQDLGAIAKDTLPPGEFADLSDIDTGGIVNEYLVKETKPFYVRNAH